MRAIIVLAAVIAAAPAFATAQDATERRLQRAADNLREMDQNQRIGEVERQVSNMEIRRQSEEVLRALQPQSRTTPTVRSPEDIARDAELAAANARLRDLARTQAVQVRDPASQAVQNQRIDQIEMRLSNIEIRRQRDEALRALQPQAPAVVDVAPVIAPPPADAAAESAARDAELAASNARLRAIAQAQRAQ